MKRLLTFALCLMLGFLPTLAPALTIDEINTQADDYFKRSKTIGGALVITLGDQIVYERYYGSQDTKTKTPVTADTYFRVASVTKLVSGIGMLQLVEQGKLELDEDISTYFGYPIANPHYPDTPITLRQLMSHTSSIRGALPTNSRTIFDTLSKEKRKKAYYLERKPGRKYVYSNFGAGVTGAMLEAVTGMSTNRYMVENVFAPLSIDAAYSADMLSDPDCIATTYTKDLKTYRSLETMLGRVYDDTANPELHYDITVGDLWIQAADLAKLAMALCGDGSVNGVRLLSQESISLMRQDQASLGASVTGKSPYGLFLQREETLLEHKTIYGHQGLVRGVLCNVYFDPETQFCFVMLTNGCKNTMNNHVGILSRRMFDLAYQTFVGDGEQ